MRSRRYRERNVSQGMCAKCGRRPFRPGYMLCDECQEKHRQIRVGGRPRVQRNVPLALLPAFDPDDQILASRRYELLAMIGPHRAAVNALVALVNERENDRDLRWRVKALVRSGQLLLEAL